VKNINILSTRCHVFTSDLSGLKKNITGGVNFSSFVEKKILKILATTARFVVTWFSQYSCLKVQNFAIIGQLSHALFPDWSFFLVLYSSKTPKNKMKKV
jgi:hypothetical protein